MSAKDLPDSFTPSPQVKQLISKLDENESFNELICQADTGLTLLMDYLIPYCWSSCCFHLTNAKTEVQVYPRSHTRVVRARGQTQAVA